KGPQDEKIKKLKMLKDPVTRRLRSHRLEQIINNNRYHSPELSKIDSNEPNKQIVVIWNLHWRFTIINLFTFLRDFLQHYVDKASVSRTTRKQVYDQKRLAENSYEPLTNAPDWTIAGYHGALRALIRRYF
ncbi:12148_t:CDS:2, partial [Dentiscutata erythropus]